MELLIGCYADVVELINLAESAGHPSPALIEAIELARKYLSGEQYDPIMDRWFSSAPIATVAIQADEPLL